METNSLIKKIAIGIVVILCLNGFVSLLSWFNSNKLNDALDRLDTANQTIVRLKSELSLAQSGLQNLQDKISAQTELLEVLDEEVRINYEQFDARLGQPTWEKRQARLAELEEKRKEAETKKQAILEEL